MSRRVADDGPLLHEDPDVIAALAAEMYWPVPVEAECEYLEGTGPDPLKVGAIARGAPLAGIAAAGIR